MTNNITSINLPRIFLRHALGMLSKLIIKKHKPTIIVISGENNPTIVREGLYSIILSKYNARRNLEKPDSEFSIPLTIIGKNYYPKNSVSWLKLIFQTIFQLIYLKPYKHFLVLQVKEITPQIYEYWLKILSPKYIIKTQDLKTNEIMMLTKEEIPHFLEPLIKNLHINKQEAKNSLSENFHPNSRISLYQGKNNSLIVDASYFYYPVKIEAVLDIVEKLEGKKYIITNDLNQSLRNIPKEYEIIFSNQFKHLEFSPKSIFIILGNTTEMSDIINKLANSEFEI